MTGTVLVVMVTLGFLAGGLLHAPARAEAERDFAAQYVAARDYAHAPRRSSSATASTA